MARNYKPQICLFSDDGRAVVNKISQDLTSNPATTFTPFYPPSSPPYLRKITIRRLFAQQSAVLNSFRSLFRPVSCTRVRSRKQLAAEEWNSPGVERHLSASYTRDSATSWWLVGPSRYFNYWPAARFCGEVTGLWIVSSTGYFVNEMRRWLDGRSLFTVTL